MYEGHGFIRLIQDTPVEPPVPILVFVSEIAAILPCVGYTEVVIKGGRRSFYVKETEADIFRLMDETHERVLALAKERFRKHNHGVAINDPGA